MFRGVIIEGGEFIFCNLAATECQWFCLFLIKRFLFRTAYSSEQTTNKLNLSPMSLPNSCFLYPIAFMNATNPQGDDLVFEIISHTSTHISRFFPHSPVSNSAIVPPPSGIHNEPTSKRFSFADCCWGQIKITG